MNSRREKIVDYLLCMAVFIQPALIILQKLLIRVYGIDTDETTIYRVLFTAIPMSIAILCAFYRKSVLFLITYVVSIIILALHASIFPQNVNYIMDQGMRFLFPVVIPSALCLMAVKDIENVEKSAVIMAWISTVLVLAYGTLFFRGRFLTDRYDMAFSSGCLFPMLILYSRKKTLPVIVSILEFIIVVVVGSRGAALVFVAFVVFDMFRLHNRYRWVVAILALVLVYYLPSFTSYLDTMDIQSRTLGMLNEGDIDNSSGRDALYDYYLDALQERPILGIGLFGDRVYTMGSYCHNLFLEILLDFGFLLGSIIIIYGLISFLRCYIHSHGAIQTFWLVFAFFGILPLMFSGSYLISNSLAILIGYSVLVLRSYRNRSA